MMFLKKTVRATLSGLAFLSTAALALPSMAATPVKVESQNVVFYGDVDVDVAKDRVRKWEIYRRMVFALSGIASPPPDRNKLTIYGFYSGDQLRTFTANPRIGGVYTQGVDGPIFLTSVNKNYNTGEWSEQVGLHEYTHHILNSVVRQGFPRWYNEGFANYLSTMQIGEDTIAVGDPSAMHVRRMKEGYAKFLDPELVLSANTFYPIYTRREARRGGGTSFYGQSTIYVHYLRNTPKYSDKLAEYLKLIETPGYTPIQAFEESHGISIDKFHREAARYYRKDEFIVNQYQPGPRIMDVDLTVSKISEADLRIAQIPARLAFLADKNERDFRKDLQMAHADDPSNPLINYGYVTMDIRDENYDVAVNRAETAMSANPDSPHAIRAAARARFARYTGPMFEELDDEYAPFEMTNDMELAVDRYRKIRDIKPVDYDAVIQLVNIYGNSTAEVEDDIFEAARILDRRYMDSFNPGWGMDLATIYAKRGFTLDACDYYQKSLTSLDQFSDKQLGAFKGRLDWFDKNYGADCQFKNDEG